MHKKRRHWTLDEMVLLESLINEGFASYAIIGLILGRSEDSVGIQAGRLGLKSKFELRKYEKNEDFWSVPNTVNSYYAGLWAADGSINWEQNFIALGLNVDDKKEIDKFVEKSGFTGSVRVYDGSGEFAVNKIAQLQINSSKKWNEDMYKNFNLFPQKTYRIAPPNLNSDLLKACYILGYLDGDGSICFTEKSCSIGLSSATKEILDWVKNFIDQHFDSEKNPFKANSCKINGKECWNYTISGNRAIHIFEFFRSLPVPKFQRKWENPEILSQIEAKKRIRPNVFSSGILSFDENGMIIKKEKTETFCHRLANS